MDYSKHTQFDLVCDNISMSNLKIKRGLDVFRKYQQYFSPRKIVVQFYDYPDATGVLMINIKNFFNIFNKYKSDFEQILGREITAEKLLAQITESDDFANALKDHEAIFGILLGYGRTNAWLFHNRSMMMLKLDQFDLSLKKKALLDKQIAEINQRLRLFNINPNSRNSLEDKDFSIPKKPPIPLPHFMADSNSFETKELKEKYEKDRANMMSVFAKQSILVVTLQQLMGE